MFAGYVDSSTVPSGSRHVFAVAGVIAPVDGWHKQFAPAWEEALAREGIPWFHMTDYEARKAEPYKSWANEKHTGFLAKLINVIERAEPIGGAVALDLEAYHRLPTKQRQRIGHPYKFCGALLLTRLSIMLARDLNTFDQVAYVFESGDMGSGELKKAVDSLSEDRKRTLLIQSFAYGSKGNFIQLQVADMVAYEAAKSAVRDIGADDRWPRKSLLAMLRIMPQGGYLFDEQTLNRWVADDRDPFGFRE
ncbi:MAG TPA: hypothetical protein VNV25_02440 [Gemmatimonadaceae bacterium]|jgi:hypothetical protein|nr:hypothetical protein [Gemmatimonadaceae bacterium]